MKRLFAAIHILPDQQFLSIYEGLQKQLFREKIRWVNTENMHITLKFFGETPIERIKSIDHVLKNISTNHAVFNLQLKKTGIFGSRYKPRVIWFGIQKNEQLTLLYKELITELDKVGFPSDRQNFVPHLTLGRMNNIRNKLFFQEAVDLVRDISVQQIKVLSITLFESQLQPSGAVHNVIEDYKLKV
jgi:2'-5' RNA ligase